MGQVAGAGQLHLRTVSRASAFKLNRATGQIHLICAAFKNTTSVVCSKNLLHVLFLTPGTFLNCNDPFISFKFNVWIAASFPYTRMTLEHCRPSVLLVFIISDWTSP